LRKAEEEKRLPDRKKSDRSDQSDTMPPGSQIVHFFVEFG